MEKVQSFHVSEGVIGPVSRNLCSSDVSSHRLHFCRIQGETSGIASAFISYPCRTSVFFLPSVILLVLNSGSHGFTSLRSSMELSRQSPCD